MTKPFDQAPPPSGGDAKHPAFKIVVIVEENDIDALGHANNVAYLRWVQDIAVAHSDAVGLTFSRYGELGGVFVVRRHELDYLRPALRGEALEVRTWIPTAMAAKCVRRTEIRRLHDLETLLQAETVWGFVDVARGRPTRIPDSVRQAFGMPPRTRSEPS